MGLFKVEQRTQDGFFNATALIKTWNSQDGVPQRKIDNYFLSEKTQEFIQTIMKKENLNTPKMVYLKTRGKYGGGTWMHPMLFIDFAMWINPSFKYDVLKFVGDQMIDYRKQAGDAYKALSSAVSKIVPNKARMKECFSLVGRALNYITFNTHSPEQRNNHGTVKEQQDLLYNEKYFADLIEQGFIKSFDELILAMRKKWVERWMPKTFLP